MKEGKFGKSRFELLCARADGNPAQYTRGRFGSFQNPHKSGPLCEKHWNGQEGCTHPLSICAGVQMPVLKFAGVP